MTRKPTTDAVREWTITMAVSAVILLSSCNRGDPLDQAIDARTADGFQSWRSSVGWGLTPDQWNDFDAALKEMRYVIMTEGKATGAAGIDAAVRSKIDGTSIRGVMVVGFRDELNRRRWDRDQVVDMLGTNAKIKTYDGDEASANYLGRFRQDQLTRLNRAVADITLARQKLEALGSPEPKPEPALPSIPATAKTVPRLSTVEATSGKLDEMPVRLPDKS